MSRMFNSLAKVFWTAIYFFTELVVVVLNESLVLKLNGK